jgi:hypothetical protein
MVSKKKIIIAAVVVTVAVVAVFAVYLWQSFTTSFTEVEATVNDFVNKASSYDAAGTWGMTTQDYQDSWGEYIEYEGMINSLYEKVWHATIQSISSRALETKNGITTASITLTARITDTEQGTYAEKWIFKLVKTGNEWKIDNWLVQE